MSTLGTLVRFLEFVLMHTPLPTAKDGLAPWPGTTDQFNDQAYWSYWYVHYHPIIGLDDGNLQLIANIGKNRRRRTSLEENGVFKVMKKQPAILHFPGQGAKDFRVYTNGKEYYRQRCYVDDRGVVKLQERA